MTLSEEMRVWVQAVTEVPHKAHMLQKLQTKVLEWSKKVEDMEQIVSNKDTTTK